MQVKTYKVRLRLTFKSGSSRTADYEVEAEMFGEAFMIAEDLAKSAGVSKTKRISAEIVGYIFEPEGDRVKPRFVALVKHVSGTQDIPLRKKLPVKHYGDVLTTLVYKGKDRTVPTNILVEVKEYGD